MRFCGDGGVDCRLLWYAVSCEEQMQIGDNLSAIVTLLAAFGAFIFRLLATRRIG